MYANIICSCSPLLLSGLPVFTLPDSGKSSRGRDPCYSEVNTATEDRSLALINIGSAAWALKANNWEQDANFKLRLTGKEDMTTLICILHM